MTESDARPGAESTKYEATRDGSNISRRRRLGARLSNGERNPDTECAVTYTQVYVFARVHINTSPRTAHTAPGARVCASWSGLTPPALHTFKNYFRRVYARRGTAATRSMGPRRKPLFHARKHIALAYMRHTRYPSEPRRNFSR